MLYVLVVCVGHVVSEHRIHEGVWGRPMPHVRDRSVDVLVRKVRARLRVAAPRWTFIHTHFGHGYRFEPELVSDEMP